MPKLTISVPNDLYEKISKTAEKNDESMSNIIIKMTGLGFLVADSKDKKSASGLSEIDEHCSKLIIQMNALVKEMAEKNLGYDRLKFSSLRDKAVDRFNEIAGVSPDEL